MDQINEQEKKLHDMAILVMALYNDKTFEKIFMEIKNTNSMRDFFKHCVCYITQKNFENEDSHQVDLMVQKIRREQAIAAKVVKMTKTEEKNYYKSLGGGNATIGKELFEKTILGRSDDDKDDD